MQARWQLEQTGSGKDGEMWQVQAHFQGRISKVWWKVDEGVRGGVNTERMSPGFLQEQFSREDVSSFYREPHCLSKCAVRALLSTDIHVQESHQKLKEEPGVLEDCFFHHSSADHHL